MKRVTATLLIGTTLAIGATALAESQPPAITGSPVITTPALLAWAPDDTSWKGADLTEPTAKGMDLHGTIERCGDVDVVLSTAGNYHMALKEIWSVFRTKLGMSKVNAVYTTSPPVAMQQVKDGGVRVGNLELGCRPSVVVATEKYLKKLETAGIIGSARVPVYESRGVALLVKKGNPGHITSVWDLLKPNVHVVTPNPNTGEPVAAYAKALYLAAAANPNGPKGATPEDLYNSIFNEPMCDFSRDSCNPKWYAGVRIHHREVPRAVAYATMKKPDDIMVGLLFYHLALDATRKFPDTFDMIPLTGTVNNPTPVDGTPLNPHFLAFVKGSWSKTQEMARMRLLDAYTSPEATRIYESAGMHRPAGVPLDASGAIRTVVTKTGPHVVTGRHAVLEMANALRVE